MIKSTGCKEQKCDNCGMRLFDIDNVQWFYSRDERIDGYPDLTHKLYRCPKCFFFKKVKVEK